MSITTLLGISIGVVVVAVRSEGLELSSVSCLVEMNTLVQFGQDVVHSLTPPPFRLLGLTMGYQRSMMVYILHKLELLDFLAMGPKAQGPRPAAEVANYLKMENVERVERILYALASQDLARLHNTPLSAVRWKDHLNSIKNTVGNLIDDTVHAVETFR